jgi:hypothetical protein
VVVVLVVKRPVTVAVAGLVVAVVQVDTVHR